MLSLFTSKIFTPYPQAISKLWLTLELWQICVWGVQIHSSSMWGMVLCNIPCTLVQIKLRFRVCALLWSADCIVTREVLRRTVYVVVIKITHSFRRPKEPADFIKKNFLKKITCMFACLSVLINICNLNGRVLLKLLMFTFVSHASLQHCKPSTEREH